MIDRPVVALGLVFFPVAFFASYVPDFKLDASSESIILEHDEALKYYRASREIYGSDDFLIVVYTPHEDLFVSSSLAHLAKLRDELVRIDSVGSIHSILDVPLVHGTSLTDLRDGEGIRTLESPGIDMELARKELQDSPIYRNNLISTDGRTTALQVIFKEDATYNELLNKRNRLREKEAGPGLTAEEAAALQSVEQTFHALHAVMIESESEDTEVVRAILDKYRDKAQLYLGGARMVVADMISFIEYDIVTFGAGILVFLFLALVYFFRAVRWVLLPMSCCLISVVVMVGYLGFMDWPVTVISSNFVSLLLIITMSLTIHLIVRYRILNEDASMLDQKTLVFHTMKDMTKPCFYTAITTIVAFCSLIVSDIRPVIDFGWMMTIGISLAFALNFLYFPAVLVLLKPEKVSLRRDATKAFTMAVGDFTLKHAKPIIAGSLLLAVLGGMGIGQLEVENRFIDHFKSTTEIYQGMELIDSKLGGTIPLDFVIDASPEETDDSFDDPFEDPFDEEEAEADVLSSAVDAVLSVATDVLSSAVDTIRSVAIGQPSYWFNGYRLTQIETIHDYLESLPEVGKVLSLATGAKVLKQMNDGRMPDDYKLALIRKYMPEDVKKAMLDPYLSPDGNQTRLTMRLIESAPTLKRKELIERIQRYLVDEMGFPEATVHPTGMALLYSHLLHSLYRSQILTMSTVFVSILLMFVMLFRRISLSIVAILPNLLAACAVLGLMGWWGIPLDIMTITIAAITVGIAVDHAIHYIHRFQVEFVKHQSYRDTIVACHGSIGRAIYYTAITITVGFSILAFSNFIPTIYFGLLTGLAMMVALISNLTLLAALLMIAKPLGPDRR
ncbi:MAG: MMPL family transporter [Nitrospira sp. SB0677_bin_15]|nr:MMPL family transporter [Nitrospira sp. SB0677_bin_15]MYH01022.1 MMPL family transporter [Nitrospira sp. SB0675_bin_23]MYJ22914.1 MMPL family transporter [Nitrospira sp. SB0673_bin_12]